MSGESHGLSVFFRIDDDVFHTYSTYARGVEGLTNAYSSARRDALRPAGGFRGLAAGLAAAADLRLSGRTPMTSIDPVSRSPRLDGARRELRPRLRHRAPGGRRDPPRRHLVARAGRRTSSRASSATTRGSTSSSRWREEQAMARARRPTTRWRKGSRWASSTACPSRSRTSSPPRACARPRDRRCSSATCRRRAPRRWRGSRRRARSSSARPTCPSSPATGRRRNDVAGTSNNPWDTTRTTGGSTGGGAGAVAAGLSFLELGGDLAGSIRIPSHCCGVYGHRPTTDVVPLRGHIPPPPGTPPGPAELPAAGPLARSAARPAARARGARWTRHAGVDRVPMEAARAASQDDCATTGSAT